MRDNFFSELVYFDKSRLSPAAISCLEEYCSSPAFTPEAVSHSSVAAACVCQWVRALHSFVQKHDKLKPLLDRLSLVELQIKQVFMKLMRCLHLLKSLNACEVSD